MNKKDVLVAATLANLCLAHTWEELLNQSDDFLRKVLPTRNMLVATVCIALLTALIHAARWTIARNPRVEKWLWWGPWLPLLVPLNGWRIQLHPLLGSTAANILFMVTIFVAFSLTVLVQRVRIETAIRTFLLLLSPLLVLTLAQAFVYPVVVERHPTMPAGVQNASRAGLSGRVVLIVFDELDQMRTFSQRPADLQLEHFDALREQSVYGENAISPEQETLLSIPSYLLNRRLSKVEPSSFEKAIGTDEETGETIDIPRSPNLFSKVFAAGGRSAVVGWYLPYCRIFLGSTYCHWETGDRKAMEEGRPFAGLIAQYFGEELAKLPYAEPLNLTAFVDPNFSRAQRQVHRSAYDAILEAATSVVASPDFDLVYLHIPVPHFPVIFDRGTGNWIDHVSDDYYSNLLLADITLGKLRFVLEASQVWNKTNVIVVGDHGFRYWTPPAGDVTAKRRVPFLLKLAGQNERHDFSSRFDTLIIHDLTLMLLQHESVPPAETVRWLAQHKVDR